MKNIKYQERFPSHPRDVRNYGTTQLREEFLIETIFEEEAIQLSYTGFDRFITGGAMPVKEELSLDAIDPLKAEHFCDRREVGIINIGNEGRVIVDRESHSLDHKDAIYIGMGVKSIVLKSKDSHAPARFYINSAPAHHSYLLK